MAAEPICAKCGSGLFTTTAYPVFGAQTLRLVHCSSCGAVVGVLEHYAPNTTADDIAAMTKQLMQRPEDSAQP